MIRLSRPGLLAFALGLAACSNSTTTTVLLPLTAIVVDPADFLGSVACSTAPGGMQTYVATLRDVSSLATLIPPPSFDASGFALPSSLPTPCTEQVWFERITIGRAYVAEIQGYDRPAGTRDSPGIIPLGCSGADLASACIAGEACRPPATCAGSPVMVDSKTLAYVAPRWSTSCGETLDGGIRADVGSLDAGRHEAGPHDAGPHDAGPRRKPRRFVSRYMADAAYLECPPVPWVPSPASDAGMIDSGMPRLNGPVCASDEETITIRGCAPLRESSETSSARP